MKMTPPEIAASDADALNALDAIAMRARLAHGQATPLAVAQACLARIAQREPVVRAWSWLDPSAVLAQARALGGAQAGLPLYGVPVGIKDIIDTADMPTAYGSALYAGHRPAADAEAVRRLRAAGAIILGKTVTTEFAYAHPGPTTNPCDVRRTPGGSSSGSAAAVADGMMPLALGTQTGGSTIRPSAYCGIVGFKPSFGVVPLDGVRPLSASMDTMGIHARMVADARLLFTVLADAVAPRLAVGPIRVAVCAGFLGEHASDAVRRALSRARAALEARGEHVVDVTPPAALAALGDANRAIMAFEAARANARAYETGRDLLGPPTRALIETGRAMPRERYEQALAAAEAGRRAFACMMDDFDAVLTYSAPDEAPLWEAGTGDSVFNRSWTTIGVPCLTLPCGRGASGLPLGVQLVGGHGGDYTLLDLGQRLEASLRGNLR